MVTFLWPELLWVPAMLALLAAVAAVVLSACLELSCAWFGRVI